MTGVILILVIAFFALDGFVRAALPDWQLNVEKKAAAKKSPNDPAPTPEQDQKRLRKIRAGGAVRLALCFVTTILIGISIGRSPTPLVPATIDALERLAFERGAEHMRSGKSVGLVIGLIAGNEERLIELGFSNLRKSVPVTKETFFEIGSITKAFTGIALACEIEAGALKLDNTLSELLPKDTPVSDEGRPITLRQLTTHTAGFPRLPGNPSLHHLLNYVLFGGDPYVGITLEKFRAALRDLKLENPAGKKMAYSNFGVSLLGWLLAERKSISYDQYIRELVLNPLGMTNSLIQLSQGYRSLRRLGPITIAFKSSPWTLGNHLAGAGGIRSTGPDMLKFLRANMRPDQSPIGSALRLSHRELFRENETRAVGMNWIRSRKDKNSKETIWHNGGTGGFMSFLGFKEDGSCGVFVLSNTSQSVDDLGMNLLKELSERLDAASKSK
jgi:serine-type D-Ala-D-Ala carboxypeptidase/endopeptidase